MGLIDRLFKSEYLSHEENYKFLRSEFQRFRESTENTPSAEVGQSITMINDKISDSLRKGNVTADFKKIPRKSPDLEKSMRASVATGLLYNYLLHAKNLRHKLDEIGAPFRSGSSEYNSILAFDIIFDKLISMGADKEYSYNKMLYEQYVNLKNDSVVPFQKRRYAAYKYVRPNIEQSLGESSLTANQRDLVKVLVDLIGLASNRTRRQLYDQFNHKWVEGQLAQFELDIFYLYCIDFSACCNLLERDRAMLVNHCGGAIASHYEKFYGPRKTKSQIYERLDYYGDAACLFNNSSSEAVAYFNQIRSDYNDLESGRVYLNGMSMWDGQITRYYTPPLELSDGKSIEITGSQEEQLRCIARDFSQVHESQGKSDFRYFLQQLFKASPNAMELSGSDIRKRWLSESY